jgi:glycerol-3-phosphate O-acyltransferase
MPAVARVLTGEAINAEVVDRVIAHVISTAKDGATLEERVHETIYSEERRLDHAEPDPRAHDDRAFIAKLRRDLAFSTEADRPALLRRVVERYAAEIGGNFSPRVYDIATRALPPALGALLHGMALPDERFFGVDDRVLLGGEIETVLALAEIGTLVLVPTHVSNLDSLLVGYAIHRLGLPPFAYGAGLNLFSSALIGVFMRNLGAYTVDRKKSDALYRDTLKEYGTTLIARGQHSLFFPGGTRSRSGAVEGHLKKGLLGTGGVAFRRALDARAPRPRVFVVPCTLTYPLVLEASTLIGDYLRAEGGPHYVDVRDEFEHPRRWLEFIHGLSQLDLGIHLRLGQPLDPVGNVVDRAGRSLDPRGREVDPAEYSLVDGKQVDDPARDAEYTRYLSSRLVAAYRRDTVALPTGVVAYALFERLRRERAQPDLFRLLRALGPESSAPFDDVVRDVLQLRGELSALAKRGEIVLAPELGDQPTTEIVARAMGTFATYHPVPVIERRGDRLHVGDANLLFYYRNRLEGLGLLGAERLLPAEAS